MNITITALPRYTKMFWFSYLVCMFWAVLAGIATYKFAPMNESFQNLNLVESALSAKMSVRRMVSVMIGAIFINILLFTHSKYLDKFLIFLAAWMWAAFIDDNLVMNKFVYIPDEIFAQTLIHMRPVIVIFVSWMAFESHLRWMLK